jgi:hypothetical protein
MINNIRIHNFFISLKFQILHNLKIVLSLINFNENSYLIFFIFEKLKGLIKWSDDILAIPTNDIFILLEAQIRNMAGVALT